MKDRKLHMIGNAHIDPVWLWQWPEGFHEVKATFRSALDRMNEYDDFIFVSSSAAFYEWVEQSDPAMFAEIRQRVAEGRWRIVGGWWIEPDCNVPCGESFARQGLYGQHYFQEKFGVTATVGYNVDSFGHSGMLPQILKKSGMSYYVFMRPGPREKGLPGRLFWWESDDGSRVMAFRLPFEYLSSGQDFEPHIRRCADEMKEPLDEFMCFYGVGNHGGGPTKANIECIHRLNGSPDLPALVMSGPEAFFKAAESKGWTLPVAHDDLQHHSSGCYAAHSGIKRWNRLAENRLLAAERFSAIAARVTGQLFLADLGHAWMRVLFNQFHDILAGTSIEPAYDDARDQLGEAMAIAGRALNLATQSLAWNIRIEPEDDARPMVVFNPHAWPVKANVEMEFGSVKATDALLDDDNQLIPLQQVQSHATCGGRNRLSFIADLPPMGYRTYRVVSQTSKVVKACEVSDLGMENDRFRIEFNPQTGCIKSLRDKRAQVEVFSGEAARPVVLDDAHDTWGHNVFKWDRELGVFTPISVRLVAHGPVKSVIRVMSEYGGSKLVQDFALYPDLDQIEVSVTVDWRESLKLLKLRFPVNVKFIKVTHEIPYGHIERFANGDEEPAQSWVDISGTSRDAEIPYGFSLLNDGKYSLDVNVHDIGFTVLRSPAYANHIPSVLEPNGFYSFIDQGIQRFNYTLLPHLGSWETADTVRRAAELNQRPIALIGTYHPQGTLPQRDSFIAIEPANMVVSAVKQAEDNDDLILRAYETAQSATRATVRLPKWGRTIETRFGPCEIKTFRVPRDTTRPVIETNLLEW